MTLVTTFDPALTATIPGFSRYTFGRSGMVYNTRFGKEIPGTIPRFNDRRANTFSVQLSLIDDNDNDHVFRLRDMIWEAFNSPVWPGHEIIHKDGNFRNCAISNLEMVCRNKSVPLSINILKYLPRLSKWVAQDADGSWCAYVEKPLIHAWRTKDGFACFSNMWYPQDGYDYEWIYSQMRKPRNFGQMLAQVEYDEKAKAFRYVSRV